MVLNIFVQIGSHNGIICVVVFFLNSSEKRIHPSLQMKKKNLSHFYTSCTDNTVLGSSFFLLLFTLSWESNQMFCRLWLVILWANTIKQRVYTSIQVIASTFKFSLTISWVDWCWNIFFLPPSTLHSSAMRENLNVWHWKLIILL